MRLIMFIFMAALSLSVFAVGDGGASSQTKTVNVPVSTVAPSASKKAVVSKPKPKPKGRMLDGDGECFVHEYDEGEIVRLNVAPYSNLHIETPFPLYDVIKGGGRLWSVNGFPGTNHFWIKTKSDKGYNGQTTSLTILDEKLKAINVVVNRRDNPGYTCAKIVAGSNSSWSSLRQDWSKYESPETRQVRRIEEQADRRVSHANRSKEAAIRHAEELLRAERANSYTNYQWETDGRLPIFGEFKSIVRGVQDNGVFTFVNLNEAGGGLLAINGVFNGKEHLVQHQFDPELLQYSLTGVYDKIILQYQDAKVEITRMGR